MAARKISMITGDFTEDYETMLPFQAPLIQSRDPISVAAASGGVRLMQTVARWAPRVAEVGN